MMGGNCYKLSAMALAFAFGIVSALFMMFFVWLVYWMGHGNLIVEQWSEIFPGITTTLEGGIIAGLWGFLEGFVFGLLSGWIYNLCLCCCKCFCRSGESCDIRYKNGKK